MALYNSAADKGIKIIEDFMVVTVKDNLDADEISLLQEAALENVKRNRIKQVIIDMSEVFIIDLDAFPALVQTGAMLRTMGSRTVYTGMRAGIVSALVNFDIDTSNMETTLNIDEGIALLRSS